MKRRDIVKNLPGFLMLAVVLGTAFAVQAQPQPARIDVFPPDIHLSTAADRQQFIVVATRADGVTEDVTAKAKITLADGKLAKVDGAILYPAADGQTNLTAEYGGQTASIPVTVKDAAAARPISYQLDVMPVFMRAGCNVGGCHGAASGKDGFRLSLFGFDPEGDYYRLTREIGFRRLNLALPERSLLLEKALGEVPHTGGKRFEKDSEYYRTLLGWIQAGAPKDPGAVPSVESVELYPRQVVLEGAETKQQFIVRAKYSDGTDRDVTTLAVYLSNNDNSAPVAENGLVTAKNRGEAFVLARFETKTVGGQILVLPAGLQYSPPQEQPVNYVDELVDAKLRRLRILPSELCSDEVFLRRVSIDITGKLPTEEEYQQFLTDQAPDKRAKLIDRLLERKEFAEIWAMKWAELLMVKSNNQVSYKSAYLYSDWLTQKISNNVPLDEMVRELLTASGGTFRNPATNFYQVETDTLKTTENVAQVFMGIRVQCAQCHNHPFDRWTMDDYYSFAAFFGQIGRKQGEDYRETIVFNQGGGEVRHPVGNRPMEPKFLGGPKPDAKGKDRRQLLAEWLTASDNPFFAASAANRVWAHFFGIGIVDPVDDMRVSNPPSNPELLGALGKRLVEYKYDFKKLVRDICNSHAYQRSTVRNASNEKDERNFAHGRVRRIQAEMLLDCISQVTQTKDKFQGLPLGARAVQVADGTTSNYFLTTFGRSRRETVCACEVNNDPTLSQSLHLLNGETVDNKIRAGALIKSLLDAKKGPDEILTTLYVRCLSRKPSPEELAKVKKSMEGVENQQQALEDIFWALLNAREFLFNH
ncbi:MAG: DUF1549 domain-containing protein [Pirellulales bacterium]|nr:DUF1549 domain-containing protein [Pirellulales bacterium]